MKTINGKRLGVVLTHNYKEIPAWYLCARDGMAVTPKIFSNGDGVIEKLTNFVAEEAVKPVSWWELFGSECVLGGKLISGRWIFAPQVQRFAETMREVQLVTDEAEMETAKELFPDCYDIARVFKFTSDDKKGYLVLRGEFKGGGNYKEYFVF